MTHRDKKKKYLMQLLFEPSVFIINYVSHVSHREEKNITTIDQALYMDRLCCVIDYNKKQLPKRAKRRTHK